MIYPKDFESKIGFDSIRSIIAGNCKSRLGKDEVRAMAFSSDFNVVLKSLRCVDEMMKIIKGQLPFPLGDMHDVLPYLLEIKAASSYMSAERLHKLRLTLTTMEEVAAFFRSEREEGSGVSKFPVLDSEFAGLELFPQLNSIISDSINKFGEVKDSASPELYDIRSKIRGAQGSMQRAMRRVMDDAIARGIIEKDSAPSIRDGRLVIPVTAGNKKEISGIVHDESASGKTVFIEPAEVVEAGNRLRQLELDEQREIIAILMRIAETIRPHIDSISESCVKLGKIDFIRAKSLFAIDVDAQMPHIEKGIELEWYHTVHPGLLLSLRNHGRTAVPLNLTLDKGHRILIISGPNAGGKSVCLKTVAIIQYMLQCGVMPTLYYNSHCGIFRNIFIDIGDEQSFENDLSTYSSHLRNMKYFLNYSDNRSLILADEMGSGTEPQIGGAMAQAILEKLGHTDCFGVVTTHYQNLKTFADSEPGFMNGAMQYDRVHLQPTFELVTGTPGSSFALDIASKIGLPKDVIDSAKNIVGSDYVNLDKYVADIQRDRRYWANKRQNIKEKESKLDSLLENYEETAGDLKSQRRQIINDAKREAKEILAGANAQIERTIREIKNVQAEKERTKQIRKELGEYTESLVKEEDHVGNEPDALRPLKHKSRSSREKKNEVKVQESATKKSVGVGDYVKMEGGSTIGLVLSISGKKAEVAFGGLRTFVVIDKLVSASKPKESALTKTSSVSGSTYEESRNRQLNFKNEIDVRGMRADEALQAVTYFLDDAVQFGAGRVRILHGTGHGILRTLIRQQLNANSSVANFEDEDVRFGGAGITVVDLK